MGCQAENEQCLCALVPSLPLSNLPATSDIGISENHVPVPCLLPALVTLLRFPPVPEPDEQCRFQVSLQLRLRTRTPGVAPVLAFGAGASCVCLPPAAHPAPRTGIIHY